METENLIQAELNKMNVNQEQFDINDFNNLTDEQMENFNKVFDQ